MVVHISYRRDQAAFLEAEAKREGLNRSEFLKRIVAKYVADRPEVVARWNEFKAAYQDQAKPDIRFTKPEIEIRPTVRETALVNRGRASASQIAEAVGSTRNSIIGHWFRARQKVAA